jgi:hypothetical protein
MISMPSKPTTLANSQLRLPAAPKLDRYGLHAYECECTRCEMGARPSRQEREIAQRSFERAEKARREEEARIARGEPAPVAPAEVKHKAAHERLQERERRTREEMARVRKPVERPATEEELAQLKREFGFRKERTGRR